MNKILALLYRVVCTFWKFTKCVSTCYHFEGKDERWIRVWNQCDFLVKFVLLVWSLKWMYVYYLLYVCYVITCITFVDSFLFMFMYVRGMLMEGFTHIYVACSEWCMCISCILMYDAHWFAFFFFWYSWWRWSDEVHSFWWWVHKVKCVKTCKVTSQSFLSFPIFCNIKNYIFVKWIRLTK